MKSIPVVPESLHVATFEELILYCYHNRLNGLVV